jgi:hypothetical protein
MSILDTPLWIRNTDQTEILMRKDFVDGRTLAVRNANRQRSSRAIIVVGTTYLFSRERGCVDQRKDILRSSESLREP